MPPLTGQTLQNRYHVQEFLGRGGMADVYKVWDSQRMASLAMKVLLEDLALDRVFVRRFTREANHLSKLQHPNIVRFYGLEKDERLVFMLMDYVDGQTLKHVIHDFEDGMPAGQVLKVMCAVCGALQYAHSQGVVHCDIKPANIMLNRHGEVLLADFGIARMSDAATTTMVGAGTPAYMAPEQVRGEDPLPQTDIYALGIVLYEMLTGGERPFTGENATVTGSTAEKVRWEQRNLPPPSPRGYNPAISPALEAVVLKCLAKKPEERYASALEVLNALSQAIAPSEPDPATTPEPVPVAPVVKQDVPIQPTSLKKTPAQSIQPVSWRKYVPLGVMVVLLGLGLAIGLWLLNLGMKVQLTQPLLLETDILSEGGSTQISPKDGMVMVYVPQGEFTMGTIDGFDNEKPPHTVYIDAFWIDKTEVTNAMFALCVDSSDCQPPTSKKSIQRSSYYGNPEFANYPVIYVSWFQARDYCKWAERRLATEAEWEKAARGVDERTYPWMNDEPGCHFANFYSSSGFCMGDTTEVGKYHQGVSPYGALDMAGNVSEWVADWYRENYYQNSPSNNPTGPTFGQQRVIRGGSWFDNQNALRVSSRNWGTPDFRYVRNNIGFRCASSE